MKDGKFIGRDKIEILGMLDKTNKLTIGNTTRRMTKGCHDIPCSCIDGNTLCIVKWIRKFKALCPPDQKRMYCFEASNKQKKVNIHLINY